MPNCPNGSPGFDNKSLGFHLAFELWILSLLSILFLLNQPIATAKTLLTFKESQQVSQSDTARDKLNLLIPIGYSALRANDYEVAISNFQKALQIDSTHLDALKGIAQATELKGDMKSALGWYQKTVAVDSTNATVFFRYGLVASALKMDTLAITLHKKVTRLKPDFWEAWFEIGRLHGNRHELLPAKQAFESSVKIKPDEWHTLFFLGVTATALREFDAAIKWLAKALALKPDDAETWFKLGLSYYELKQHVKADSSFLRLLELTPEFGPGLLWYAINANTMHNLKAAGQYAKRAKPVLTEKQDRLNCALLMADIYLNTSQPDSALTELQHAVFMDNNDLRVHEQLARTHLAKGDYKKANEEYSVIEQIKRSATAKK